ncbi:MAG: hypothetical protein L0Y35_09615 [Flammeovirgaceae bacterium]|nr:hypothetical protein [Flammeovirgaceae bacterium]
MEKGLRILKWVLLGFAAVGLITFGTMWLWNWLVPDLFNGPVLGFWQTLGLLLLTKIFGMLLSGKRHHQGSAWGWKYRMYQKFSTMSPEQREVFKQRMKEKWCHPPGGTSDRESTGSEH